MSDSPACIVCIADYVLMFRSRQRTVPAQCA
jgi:hypothetical protein